MDDVVAAAAVYYVPYDLATSIHNQEIDGRPIALQIGQATDELRDVLRVNIVHGRWFEPADAALGYTPVVIDRDLARDRFGDADPLGQELTFGNGPLPRRVVGVLDDFRKHGEFSSPTNFMWVRRDVEDAHELTLTSFLVRTQPGTTAEFERRVSERMRSLVPGIDLEVQPLARMRDNTLKVWIAPLIAAGIVAAFLLLMVALGLIGVLWQNVTQRTREIGLRRAAGAAEGQIHRQIVLEVLLLTSISLALGTVTVLQLPLFDQIQAVPPGVFAMSLVLSIVLMLVMTGACALYPSWMATRVPPAAALHWE
jgi:putative ABC transport system permease protein